MHNLIDLISGKPKKGATVELTVNSVAQQAAWNALKASGRESGVVAINPQTGAILALASYPSFDPNLLATLDGKKLIKNDKQLLADPAHPLINNAISHHVPARLDLQDRDQLHRVPDREGRRREHAGPRADQAHPAGQHHPADQVEATASACGNGKVSLLYAFTVSCNTAFGDLGLHLSGSALRAQANKYNFNNPNQTLAPGMQVAQSNFPLYTDPAQRAGAAIGQESDTVTPLQEAMLSATVANDGVLMKPYLVQKVTAPDLSAVATTIPTTLSTAVTPTQAAHLQTMMTSVVQSPARHRSRHRRNSGHRGDRDRREDRNGPERHQQLGAGRRGIHLVMRRPPTRR